MFEPLIDEVEEFPLPWWVELEPVDPQDFDEPADYMSALLAEVAVRPVGPRLVAGLDELDVSLLSANDAVTYAQLWERAEAWLAGMKATATAVVFEVVTEAAAVRLEGSARFVVPELAAVAELGAALHVAPRTADRRVQQAVDLAGPTRPLRDAMTSGLLSAAHVSAVSRELERLPTASNPALADAYAQQCAKVLATVIPYAQSHTPWQAARKTRMLVAAVDPDGVRERRREITERQHGVFLQATEAGTCELTAVMPLAHGHAVLSAVNALAGDARFETADGCVTIGQRRVAALVALTLGDPGSVGKVDGPVAEAKLTAHLDVVVPLSTMLAANAAGTIGGETVPADALAELLADLAPSSTLRRLVTDGAGCVIDAGRTRYAISDAQRRLIELRDVHCRFPGCRQPAERCDVDHAHPYREGGGTDTCNLGPLCRHHHQLKTHGNWRIIRSERNGRCTWKSPLGRIYQHEPPDLLPPPRQAVAVADGPPPF